MIDLKNQNDAEQLVLFYNETVGLMGGCPYIYSMESDREILDAETIKYYGKTGDYFFIDDDGVVFHNKSGIISYIKHMLGKNLQSVVDSTFCGEEWLEEVYNSSFN